MASFGANAAHLVSPGWLASRNDLRANDSSQNFETVVPVEVRGGSRRQFVRDRGPGLDTCFHVDIKNASAGTEAFQIEIDSKVADYDFLPFLPFLALSLPGTDANGLYLPGTGTGYLPSSPGTVGGTVSMV